MSNARTITVGTSEDVTRDHTFSATGPVTATVHLVSGDVASRTTDGTDVAVRISARGPHAQERLDATEVDFDAGTGALTVRSPLRGPGKKGRGLLSFFTNDDIDVELSLPTHSSLDLHTVSGDSIAQGSYGTIEVSTASGDAIVDTARSLEVKTASGDITATSVTESLDAKSSSGDVVILGAQGTLRAASVSGDVSVQVTGTATSEVHSVSGDVAIGVVEGLTVSVNARTTSGDLRSDIDLSDSSETAPADGVVTITTHTVSGDVHIRRASATGSSNFGERVTSWLNKSGWTRFTIK